MIECDLKDCVLNKRGECMKTFYEECPYYTNVILFRIYIEKCFPDLAEVFTRVNPISSKDLHKILDKEKKDEK